MKLMVYQQLLIRHVQLKALVSFIDSLGGNKPVSYITVRGVGRRLSRGFRKPLKFLNTLLKLET